MLEDILKKYFNCKEDMFNAEGGLTKKGAKIYNKLIGLLYEVGELTEVDVNEIVDNLDFIIAGH